MSAPSGPAIGGAARHVEMLGAKRRSSAQRAGGVPFVSVIIAARNAEQHIGRCLDSVLGQDYPPERMEILVLDGMSTDGTPEIVRRYAGEDTRVKLLENPQRIVPTALDVQLIMDNYATHKHDNIPLWLAQRPRYHLDFTPTYASWLNQVQTWFSPITHKAMRRGSFTSSKALVQKIDEFVQSYNSNSSPFVWTGRADSILEKMRRLCEVISGT